MSAATTMRPRIMINCRCSSMWRRARVSESDRLIRMASERDRCAPARTSPHDRQLAGDSSGKRAVSGKRSSRGSPC
jgi:hypothetical protein